MTKESRMEKLITLLDKAGHIMGQISGGCSRPFISAEEFHKALIEITTNLKQGDHSQLSDLQLWFSPAACWDDFAGMRGFHIGNEVNELLSRMTKFLPLAKLSA